MLTLDVQIVTLPEQPAAVVRGHVTAAEIPGFLGAAYGEVVQALAGQWLAPEGPPFARYHPAGEGFDVAAGFPTSGPLSPVGRVDPDRLPGGQVATVLYQGAYDRIAEAYRTVFAWLADNGYAVAGDPWESYLDEPDAAEPRTILHVPCSGA